MGRVRVDRGSSNKGSLALQQVIVLTDNLRTAQVELKHAAVQVEKERSANRQLAHNEASYISKIKTLENRVDELINKEMSLTGDVFAFNARRFKVTGMITKRDIHSTEGIVVDITIRTILPRRHDMVKFQNNRCADVRLVPA